MIGRNIQKLSFILFMTVLLAACSRGGNERDGGQPPTEASLVYPEDGTECNTGVIDTDDEAFSTVTFRWDAAETADSYEVVVTNNEDDTTTSVESESTRADIRIKRGVSFSWHVISNGNNTDETAVSETFQFYNEGPGVENYVPFPSKAVQPQRGSFITADEAYTLIWETQDLDNDLASYEVFMGTDEDALNSLGTVTEPRMENVDVSTPATYYWYVVATDAAQNESISQLFEFKAEPDPSTLSSANN